MVGDKVVGTLEVLHYKEDIWKAMSKEQRGKVVELRKAKSAGCAVKAATTSTAGPVPMDVSDQLQTLTCAVQSLDSSRDGGRQLTIKPVPADAANAPGLGAQVVRMALISQERMQGAVHVDG